MLGAHTAHRTGSSSPRSSDSEGVKRQTAPLHRSPENWIKMNVAQSKRRADKKNKKTVVDREKGTYTKSLRETRKQGCRVGAGPFMAALLRLCVNFVV